MSFLYPRVVSITRPVGSQVVGKAGYQGSSQSNEQPVARGIPASIQASSTGRISSAQTVPSAAPGPIHWKIFIPLNALAKGTVRDRDIITDDEGDRYQVEANYWNSLGYRLSAIRLEIT